MRNIVITGASSGIGKELASLFQKDDNVITISRSNIDSPNHYICDVSDLENVKQVFDSIKTKYGHIDILINNAGFGLSGAIELLPAEEVKKLFDVNFFGVLYCTQCALPLMDKGSKIINISSVCALFALPYRAMYCASKSAVNMLSFGLNMECKKSGIQCCAICPGDTKTNFTANRVKIDSSNARYGESITNSAKKIDSREDKRMPVEKVAKKIYKITNKTRLPYQKIIGFKYKVFYFLSNIVPKKLFLSIVNKMFNK